jgi:hypothetical protein
METMLIAILTAIISCIALFLTMGKVFMTRRECALQHQAVQTADSETAGKIQELIHIQSLQFKMLRSLIVYMDIPKEKKDAILNMSGQPNDR